MVLGLGDIKHSGLEETLSDKTGHLEKKPLTLEEIKDRIINTSYCPREVVEQIKEAPTRERLNSLGYKFIEAYPMTVYDIFKFTEDKPGCKKVLDEKLITSDDPMLLSYACFAIAEDKPQNLNRFGYVLLDKNPKLAALVFHVTDDKNGFEKAIDNIGETNPRQAQSLKEYYSSIESAEIESPTEIAYFLEQNCVHKIIQRRGHRRSPYNTAKQKSRW